jgi:uncharacterized protein (TIGR03382 family)
MIAAALVSLVAALQPGKMPQLQYYGGRVLSTVHIVAVRWGTSVAQSADELGGFYGALTQASTLSWLDEYATGAAGTNQHIGGGTLDTVITIAPVNKATTISDSDIETELLAQMSTPPPPGSPGLPKPGLETLYMVHFPPGVKILSGTAQSCQSGGFCAYHATYDKAVIHLANHLLVGVIPDHSAGSGCDVGCGDSSDPFQNVMNSASHEVIETVTDPDIGLLSRDSPLAAPAAWYDPQVFDLESDHGEIADICAARATGQPPMLRDAATIAGTTYVVQKSWSNKFNACVGNGGDAFSITAPATAKIANLGAPVAVEVQTTVTAGGGTPQVTLNVWNPPTGISVGPGTTSAGGKASISVTAAQGVSLPATMTIHADSAPDPNTPNDPQTTALAIVQLTAADFRVTPQLSQAQMSGVRISAGTSADVTLAAITAAGDTDSDLALTFQGPTGMSATISPANLQSSSAGTPMVATIAVDHGTPSGAVAGIVSASSGLVIRTAPLLIVVDGDDFSMSLDKSQDSVVRGGAVSVVVKTFTTHGSPQALTLSAHVPDGIAASFSPPQIQSGQTSTLTLNTGGAKSFGPQPVTIVAQGPHVAQQAPFSLGVGQSQTGCSSAGGAPALAALALLILRRRR